MAPSRHSKGNAKKGGSSKASASSASTKKNATAASATTSVSASIAPTTASTSSAVSHYVAAFSVGGEHASVALLPTAVFSAACATSAAALSPEIIADAQGERLIPAYVAFVDRDDANGTAFSSGVPRAAFANSSSFSHLDVISTTEAFAQRFRNPTRTISAFVPLVALPADHPKVLAYNSWSPVPIAAPTAATSATEHAVFQVPSQRSPNGFVEITAANLCTHLFSSLRAAAESHCGHKISSCVITHPTDFTSAQVAALKACARAAALDPAAFVPTADAVLIAHDAAGHLLSTASDTNNAGNNSSNNKDGNTDDEEDDDEEDGDEKPDIAKQSLTLVADFGATATTLSLHAVDNGLYSALSPAVALPELGARVMDLMLVSLISSSNPDVAKAVLPSDCTPSELRELVLKPDFPKLATVLRASGSTGKRLAKLRTAIERCRRELTTLSESTIYAEALYSDGRDLSTSLDKLRMNISLSAWGDHLKDAVVSTLESAGVDALEVDRVLLAGGAARSPLVRRVLGRVCPAARFPCCVQPFDELAVLGAAYAIPRALKPTDCAFANVSESSDKTCALLPRALGVLDAEGRFRQLAAAFTPLPFRQIALIPCEQSISSSSNFKIVLAESDGIADEDEMVALHGEDAFIPLYNASPVGELVVSFTGEKKNLTDACVRLTLDVDASGETNLTADAVQCSGAGSSCCSKSTEILSSVSLQISA